MNKTRNRASGAALLEAMLSVSLISIGMLVSMRAIGSGASTQSRLEKRAVVRRLAEQHIVQLAADKSAGFQQEMSGQFDPPFSEYRWRAVSSPETELAPFRLLELEVWKTTQGDRKEDAYSLQTLVR